MMYKKLFMMKKNKKDLKSLFYFTKVPIFSSNITFFRFPFLNKKITTNNVKTSATGTVIHTPLIPMNCGKMLIPNKMKIIPRQTATIIDDSASPIDVKYPENKMFNPLKKNVKA